jgi:protein-disulfide isomerase
MRKMTILAAGAAVMLATAAGAQQQPAQPPASPAPEAPNAPSAAPTIQTISIVDIKELPEATQAQVNDVVAKRSDADLQKLRSSIDATPEIKSALEAKGLTSEQVIAASMGNNGALTLITKKPS